MEKFTPPFAEMFQRDMKLHAEKLLKEYGANSVGVQCCTKVSETKGMLEVYYFIKDEDNTEDGTE